MNEAQALAWIDGQHSAMVALLRDWCDTNSGSHNAEGLARMREKLVTAFAPLGADAEEISLPSYESIDGQGATITVATAPGLSWKQHPTADTSVFLCIHMDTVYGIDDPFQSCRLIDEHTLNGPGVADAKGGLVVMLYALRALELSDFGGRLGWEVYINPDEELGSPGSMQYFTSIASQYRQALLFEPTLPDGTLVDRRKGSGNFTILVRGVAAHAGREFEKGRNALVELSRLVVDAHELNKLAGEITLNVGRVEGGGALNVVPDFAIARINARVADESAGNRLLQHLHTLVDKVNGRDGFSCELRGGLTSPAKIPNEATRRLQRLIERCGDSLGIPIDWKSTGGTCDGNKLHGLGLPNIDTLGVRGGSIHSPEEFVLLESLAERAKLAALVLMRLAAT